MAQIAHTNYNKAYVGLCFESRDFTVDTSQFSNRWNQVPDQQRRGLCQLHGRPGPTGGSNPNRWSGPPKCWALGASPIIFPYVDLWDDSKHPDLYQRGRFTVPMRRIFSSAITNWIGCTMTAPGRGAWGPGAATGRATCGTMKIARPLCLVPLCGQLVRQSR